MKIYAKIGGTSQRIGGDKPEGYVEVSEERIGTFYIGKSDGTWEYSPNLEADFKRIQGYGNMQDQLDEIYDDINAWRTRIGKVKSDNPKV